MSSTTFKTVAKTGTVQIANSSYSVTYKLINKKVEVRHSSDNLLQIYYNNKFVTVHKKINNGLSINPEDVAPGLRVDDFGKQSRQSKLIKKETIDNNKNFDDELKSQASINISSLAGGY